MFSVYVAYQYLLKVESSSSEVPIITYGRIQVTLIGDSLLNETFTLTKYVYLFFLNHRQHANKHLRFIALILQKGR